MKSDRRKVLYFGEGYRAFEIWYKAGFFLWNNKNTQDTGHFHQAKQQLLVQPETGPKKVNLANWRKRRRRRLPPGIKLENIYRVFWYIHLARPKILLATCPECDNDDLARVHREYFITCGQQKNYDQICRRGPRGSIYGAAGNCLKGV